jgi:hypothetical protein
MKTVIQQLESLFYNEAEPTINTNSWVISKEAFEKLILIAKEKEKEHILNSFKSGWNWNFDAEKYYNETYNE